MNIRLSSEQVYDEAAYWAARMDAGALPAEDQAIFEQWLGADTRHFGAYAQACALLTPIKKPLPMRLVEPAGTPRRHFLIGGGIAAALLAVVGARNYSKWFFGEDRYRTQIGEMKVIPLSDGSVVTLNTNSEIAVMYTRAQRLIELVHGEALFDVAKNKHRPFIVQTGTALVRAVGTSFSVKVLPDQPVQVLVREGIVEVKRPGVPVAPVVLVAMNNRAIAPQDAPITAKSVETSEVGRELAWRVGRLAFHGETLTQAAAEFARYSDARIEIDDPEIASQKVTGLFVSTDPVGFANAIAISFDLHTDITDGRIRITR
jgi:transmembrane sensor